MVTFWIHEKAEGGVEVATAFANGTYLCAYNNIGKSRSLHDQGRDVVCGAGMQLTILRYHPCRAFWQGTRFRLSETRHVRRGNGEKGVRNELLRKCVVSVVTHTCDTHLRRSSEDGKFRRSSAEKASHFEPIIYNFFIHLICPFHLASIIVARLSSRPERDYCGTGNSADR